ncbi:hypothetical protein MTR67_003191 [Solanum verrucosum]|uniref:Uncharacterized protein n=1 Tax=Solanum verrucosum TaxID=315347 RepID=A0AAF0PWE6_SOLVR|nr:hypothetical protein MTR67_003191 [Solanum verrucosum]
MKRGWKSHFGKSFLEFVHIRFDGICPLSTLCKHATDSTRAFVIDLGIKPLGTFRGIGLTTSTPRFWHAIVIKVSRWRTIKKTLVVSL